MKYLSSTETAKKWGITKARVIVLAKEERILGATRAGRNWLIPENAEKPTDMRYKKRGTSDTDYEYRFPFFMFGPFPSDELINTLTDDEKILFEAQVSCCRCDYDHCIEILSNIVDSISNVYTEIGALYTLSIASAANNRPDCFNSSISKLKDIFTKDFPYKKDFSYIMYDIYSMYLGNDLFINDFNIDPEYDYLEDILPFLFLQATFREMLLSVKTQRTLAPFYLELECKKYEQNHYYYVALRLHIYIGLIYVGLGQENNACFHLRRAAELGLKYDLYDTIITSLPYFHKYYNHVFENISPDFQNKLQNLSQILSNNILSFLGSETMYIDKVLELTEEERQLMLYAVRKFSNKKISGITGIPEYTIRRKYEKLLTKFNITNKNKLGEYYLKIITEGYK